MRLLGLTVLVAVGVGVGVGLEVLTVLLARYGPSGSMAAGAAWSLRGNGALVVPFCLGPLVLIGGWTVLAIRPWGGAPRLAAGVVMICGLVAGFAVANALLPAG